MKKYDSIIITIVFCLLLIIPLAATLTSEKKSFSEWENRDLQDFPNVNASTVFSGKFGADFETWLTDHFFARDFWVKFKRTSDSLLMIREANGVIVGDKALFDIPEEPKPEIIEKNIGAINAFSEKGVPTSVILVPSSGSVFSEKLPSFTPDFGELELIEDIYSKIENAKTIDTYPILKEMGLENAFYKTDHHWTSKGAANVFCAWAGLDNNFEFETLSNSFYGTLSSRSGDARISPDKFEKITSGDAFVSCRVFDGLSWTEYDSMYFDEYLDKKDKYSYFLGTNQPIVELDTGELGKTIIIFKDSFSHSFAQCLSSEYSKVILVDLRYLANVMILNQYKDEIDEVLFLFGLENFTTLDNSLAKIFAKEF